LKPVSLSTKPAARCPGIDTSHVFTICLFNHWLSQALIE
jgi:hypothetical protein